MKDFKKLRVWQIGIEIANEAYDFISSFPKEERFGLSMQITRAAVSIPSNIAEGSSRSSNKDYARFIEIAIGSAFELETHVIVAISRQYGDQTIGNKLIASINTIQKMLMSFQKMLVINPRSA
jgi:four helix bundle protein